MNNSLEKESFISTVILWIYIIFFISIFFSFRGITSISIAALLIAAIIKQKGNIKNTLLHNPARWLLLGCAIFFLLQLIALFYTNNLQEEWRDIQLKSSILFLPLGVILAGPVKGPMWKKLLPGYCLPLAIAGLYCLVVAFLNYRDTGDKSVFFYHELGKPLEQHAVYFSIFIFIGLLFLLENMQKKYFITPRIVSLSLILFFTLLLFLLSSKLVISFYVLYLIYYFISLVKRDVFRKSTIITVLIGGIVLVTAVFITKNPISARFRDIMRGDLSLVEQDKYTPGDYFNGIQFRLLQWKLVPEILSQHKSWLKGVGSANAQPFLDQEYVSKNMYLGDPATGKRGYPGYNTHNQFLESLLKYGIPGLLAFLFIFFALIKMIGRIKQTNTRFVIALLLIYCIIESVFETQYGIVLFTFFPSFLFQRD
jgi:O-antigen ligase